MDQKTQEELRAEFRRLFEADLLDEAEAVQKLLEPLSDDEWLRQLHEAPLDDEPLTGKEQQRIAQSLRRRERLARHAG
jgi:hypothetical protein